MFKSSEMLQYGIYIAQDFTDEFADGYEDDQCW